MWWRKETDLTIDIQPRGEEDRHIAAVECECTPTVGKSDNGKTMVIHRTFDGMAGFEMVGETEERRAA